MPWIKVYSELWDSWKIPTLCEALDVSEAAAVGHLISLWNFTERNAWRDGDLTKWGSLGISKAGRWHGDSQIFIKGLQSAGFLDGLKIHEWEKHQAGMIHDRERRNPREIPAKSPLNTHPDKRRVEKSRVDEKQMGAAGALSSKTKLSEAELAAAISGPTDRTPCPLWQGKKCTAKSGSCEVRGASHINGDCYLPKGSR